MKITQIHPKRLRETPPLVRPRGCGEQRRQFFVAPIELNESHPRFDGTIGGGVSLLKD